MLNFSEAVNGTTHNFEQALTCILPIKLGTVFSTADFPDTSSMFTVENSIYSFAVIIVTN